MFQNTPYAQAFLKKQAFVPYTQEAMNPPAPGGGQVPPPEAAAGQPMPPETQGASAQGAAPNIQIVQGPNGEPVDAETGFIVLDPQQGIEQDPLTGILFNKSLNEFATPEGQPLDTNEAIQMIEQARQQAGEAGGQPVPPGAQAAPADAAPEQVPPEAAPAPQGPQTFDPSTGMMIDDATGMPVDPNTGMPVDPNTGAPVDPQTGAPAQVPQGGENLPFTSDPEVLQALDAVTKDNERLAKTVSGLNRNVNSIRTDIQGLRRELHDKADAQEATFQRMDNLLSVLEQALGGVK